MFKSFLAISVVVTGMTLGTSLGTGSAAAADGVSVQPSAASQYGCLGETQTWLPGALQIEDQRGVSPPNARGPQGVFATATADCALV